MNRLIFYCLFALLFTLTSSGVALAEPVYLALCRDDSGTARWRVENCTFVFNDESRPAPDRGLAAARRAAGLLELGFDEEAQRNIVMARRLASEDLEVRRISAAIEGTATGRPERAIADLNSLIEESDANPSLLFDRAMAFYRHQDYDKALADIDRSIAQDPKNAEFHRLRGLVLTALTRNEESVLATTEAIRLNPGNVMLHIERSGPAFVSGQFELARDDLEFALGGEFERYPMWRVRGGAHYALGAFEAATRDFVHDIKLEPTGSSLHVWRFLAEYRAGKATKADAAEIAALSPDNWPSALLALLAGEASLQQVEAQASEIPELAETRRSQILFFLGEWELLNGGSVEVANGHFRQLVEGGVKSGFFVSNAADEPSSVNDYNVLEFGLASARLKGTVP